MASNFFFIWITFCRPIQHIKDCSLDLVALEMRFYGATVCPKLDRHITHVVVDQRYEMFQNYCTAFYLSII